MTHACGVMHPFALDSKDRNRGYTSSCLPPVYGVPLLEEVVDEASMREYANFLRTRMKIYPAEAALAAGLEELVPEHYVHALPGRFEMQVANPLKLQEDVTSARRRRPPRTTPFHRTNHLWPTPQCLEIMRNNVLLDPFGAQRGRRGH
jgi:hypothetical protein